MLKKLVNVYTGEIVFCKNIDDVLVSGDMKFVTVYKQDNPEREYRVNIEAFHLVDDK